MDVRTMRVRGLAAVMTQKVPEGGVRKDCRPEALGGPAVTLSEGRRLMAEKAGGPAPPWGITLAAGKGNGQDRARVRGQDLSGPGPRGGMVTI